MSGNQHRHHGMLKSFLKAAFKGLIYGDLV